MILAGIAEKYSLRIVKFITVKCVILLFLVGSCESKQKVNWSFDDTLIYVEGDELYAGKFGDIIILNPSKKEKQRLTEDIEYDASPFFSAKDSVVIFLSKRGKNNRGHGLARQNNIYRYDLKSNIINSNPLYFASVLSSLLYYDGLNSKIYYQALNDGKFGIYESNLKNSKSILVVTDEISDDITRIFASTDGDYLLFQYFKNSGIRIHNSIVLYDKLNHNYQNLLLDKVDDTLGNLSEVNCKAGSFIQPKKIIFSCISAKKSISKVFEYEIKKGEINTIFKSNELNIFNPISHSNTSTIYFIATDFSNKDDNIWMLENLSLKKITDSNTEKDWLQVKPK